MKIYQFDKIYNPTGYTQERLMHKLKISYAKIDENICLLEINYKGADISSLLIDLDYELYKEIRHEIHKNYKTQTI